MNHTATATSAPHNNEAEQSVLGALLLDNDAIDRIGDLRAEHFYRGEHRLIFSELQAQIAAGKSCDVISLADVLRDRIVDCLPYLNSLAQNTPYSSHIARYAGIVRDRAIKRGLMALGREVADQAGASREEAAVLLDRASSRLEQLAISRTRQEPVKASADLYHHIEELERRREGGSRAISTGFADVDDKLSGGLRGGELVVLAARPKMGKTAFALNLACNIAQSNSVLVLSMEMPRTQLHDRNLASIGRIPLAHLLQPNAMTSENWNSLTAAIAQIDAMQLYLDDQGGLRLLDVRMKAKTIKRRHGLHVMVVDYLQLMEGEGDNRNAQIEGITRGLKALAKELDIAIILLSQLNRELEKRPNKRPQASDLRDSGAIEQDADAVIFLYRDEVYHPDSMDRGICEVDVALCRQGAPGRAALAYVGAQTRFENLMQGWRPGTNAASSVLRQRALAEQL
ncbi:replicative DNA helicase [Undibacterium sp.]|uniref:replicative DNA helicase n=1 Tax=Undibacterium sp. TaxID=1914977 RepID=UPI00374DDAA2